MHMEGKAEGPGREEGAQGLPHSLPGSSATCLGVQPAATPCCGRSLGEPLCRLVLSRLKRR